MATALPAGEAWLRPLDRARTALFVRALQIAPLRAVLVEKRRRIPALLLAHAGAAFVLSVFAPTLLLMLGPLLLGAPHLLADLRYLVLRPALRRGARAWLLGGAVLMLGLRIAELAGLPVLLRYELSLAALWIGGSAAFGAPRLRDLRLLAFSGLVAVFAVVAWMAPSTLRLIMAHAHNPIALGVWALVFPQARGRALAVAFALAVGVVLLLTTPLAWLGFKHGLPQAFGLHAFVAADQLAPFAQTAQLSLGILASFAFLQSAHYAVWLHAIPQEATRSEGTLSFRMSFRAFRNELGAWGSALAALIVIAVPLAGFIAPLRTQSIYLSLATFHAYLELGVLSIVWLRRRGLS